MDEPVLRSVLAFLALVLCCGALIAATAALTGDRIEENRARRFLRTLTELTGSARAAADVEWSGDVAHLCTGRALLRGTAEGYGGPVRWLAAANVSAETPVLHAIRITEHQETPGIVDFLDEPTSGWLGSLPGATAGELRTVDAVSGATITSRAIARSLAEGLTRPALDNPECDA